MLANMTDCEYTISSIYAVSVYAEFHLRGILDWSHSSVYTLISPLLTRFWVKIYSIILFTRFSIYAVFPGKQKTRKRRRECTSTSQNHKTENRNSVFSVNCDSIPNSTYLGLWSPPFSCHILLVRRSRLRVSKLSVEAEIRRSSVSMGPDDRNPAVLDRLRE